MLPDEIDPFADHHIVEIEADREEIRQMLASTTNDKIEIDRDLLFGWSEQMLHSSRAVYRFKVCMADEVRQKQRLRENHHDCLLNHKMK